MNSDIDKIKELAKEFKEKMKDLYEKVSESSSAKEIQKVCSEIDAFLSINFKTTIDSFAKGEKTTMEKDKELTDEEVTAIGEAFPYPEYPKVVLEWREGKKNKPKQESQEETKKCLNCQIELTYPCFGGNPVRFSERWCQDCFPLVEDDYRNSKDLCYITKEYKTDAQWSKTGMNWEGKHLVWKEETKSWWAVGFGEEYEIYRPVDNDDNNNGERERERAKNNFNLQDVDANIAQKTWEDMA